MTLREYQLRMEAWQLREIALQDHLWQLAFYTRDAKSNNGKKYRFKGPSDVFQTEKAIDKVRSTYEPWYTSPRKNQNGKSAPEKAAGVGRNAKTKERGE